MISVIICTYNGEKRLKTVTNSLSLMNVPINVKWEIIIVDNNSNDCTKQIVFDVISKTELPLRYAFEPVEGLSHARNRGIRESAGDIVAFVDDDVYVPHDWLYQVHSAFSLYAVDVIGGRAVLRFEQSIPSWIDDEMQKCFGSFDRGGRDIIIKECKEGMPGIGANLCFKKKVFDDIGIFDASSGRSGNKLFMGEETEIIRRILNSGRTCVYYPEMYVFHIVSSKKMTKNYVLRWSFRMGQWEARSDIYYNPSIIRRMRYCFWFIKKIFKESAKYLFFLVTNNDNKSFKHLVEIVSTAGYISQIFVR